MRYELLVQTGDPKIPYDVARAEAALAGRGVTLQPDGTRVWRLKSGEVEVRSLVEGGVVLATEIRVPLQDNLDLVRDAVVEGAALAEELGARLYDPQLSRTLTARDEGVATEQYLLTAKYAGEMMGLPEAVSLSFSPPPEGMSASTRTLLWLGGALVAGYVLLEMLVLP